MITGSYNNHGSRRLIHYRYVSRSLIFNTFTISQAVLPVPGSTYLLKHQNQWICENPCDICRQKIKLCANLSSCPFQKQWKIESTYIFCWNLSLKKVLVRYRYRYLVNTGISKKYHSFFIGTGIRPRKPLIKKVCKCAKT